jgi:hypothetical protein
VSFSKLIVAKRVNTFLSHFLRNVSWVVLWTPRVHFRVLSSPILALIPIQLDSVHTPTFRFLRSILIPSSHLRLVLPSSFFIFFCFWTRLFVQVDCYFKKLVCTRQTTRHNNHNEDLKSYIQVYGLAFFQLQRLTL